MGMISQFDLDLFPDETKTRRRVREVTTVAPDLASYDFILNLDSGGKDSTACALALIEAGAPMDRVELWHHDVDGGTPLMDWPCTVSYCRQKAGALGLPFYLSWREGGFLREMMRDGTPTAPILFEAPDGRVVRTGGKSPQVTTRRKFPALGAIESGRWCSGKCKVEVFSAAVTNQSRFDCARILVVMGERSEEGGRRQHYASFEAHPKLDTRTRHVDIWRPVHAWRSDKVWAILRRHGIRPHPCYEIGFGRASCACCIFGSANQWATLRLIAPEYFERVAGLEESFGFTIRQGITVRGLAEMGKPYPAAVSRPDLAALAMSHDYKEQVRIDPATWALPAGAYGENCGPT